MSGANQIMLLGEADKHFLKTCTELSYMSEEDDDSESSSCCISESAEENSSSSNEYDENEPNDDDPADESNEYEENELNDNNNDPTDESNEDGGLNRQQQRLTSEQIMKMALCSANLPCNFDQTSINIMPKMDPFWIVIPSSTCLCLKTGLIHSIYFDKQMITIGGDSHDDIFIWNGPAGLTRKQLAIKKRHCNNLM